MVVLVYIYVGCIGTYLIEGNDFFKGFEII
jgi:hypothetical protein